MNLLRRVRRFFAGSDYRSASGAFRSQTEAFRAAQVIVRCYYVVLFYFAAATMQDWSAYRDRQEVLPLWPVGWLDTVPLQTGMLGILAGYLAAAFLGAVFSSRRWARALAFVGLFEFVALENSFGKINHNYHLWVLTACLLMFLPDAMGRSANRVTRQRFLTIFWACQAIALLTYTMSGIGKVVGAACQLCAGQNNIFMPTGLATIIANRLLQTSSSSWLGAWIIVHPWVGWPLGLISVYLEFFAIWVAFRSSLHRWWAVGLILFHIGVYLTMTIAFTPAALLLGLLFLVSPFRAPDETFLARAKQLPLFSLVFGRAFRGL